MTLETKENKMKNAVEEAKEILQNNNDKTEAVLQAIEKINEAQYSEIIDEILSQSEKAASDKEYAKSLGLRTLSKEEKDFYEKLKDAKQAINGNQIDIFPNTIIDLTLEDVRKESKLLKYITFAPANVKKWLSASKTGAYSWTSLTDKIKGELTSSFAVVNIEVAKLTVYMVIPKAIRDLSLPFVDKYIRAILKEQLNDGLEFGALQGTGKDMPIGIYKQIASKNEDGTSKDKTINTNLTSFKPKALAPAKKYLTKNGARTIDKLILVCHPNDEADYVAPAIYDAEGRLVSSYKNLEVVTSVGNPSGKAALMIPNKYTMGLTGLGIKEYDQTMALDDADVVIGKGYANGRASDDNIAYVFDVTKLEEYVPEVKVVGTVTATVDGTVTTSSEAQGA